jgi:hypothetical protein
VPDYDPREDLPCRHLKVHRAALEQLPGAPVGDIKPPIGQGAKAPLEPRHRIGEERLAIDGSACGDLQTRRSCSKSRIKFRNVAAHIQPETNNQPGGVTARIARLSQDATHLAEALCHTTFDVANNKIIWPLQPNGADLHSGGIFDRVGDRQRELSSNAPPAICINRKWRTSASAQSQAHQQACAWCVKPGATATTAAGALRLGANQQRRIGGNQTGEKTFACNVVGGVNGIEPFNGDLRQSNYSVSTASGVARSNVSCNASSARGASDSLTMQVMRISDVEII